jgi:PAS domain S-box-containing protein
LTDPAGREHSRRRHAVRALVAAAIATPVALAGHVALVFVPRERAAAIASRRAERESAAESRVAAIRMWVELRLGDAQTLATLPSVGRLLSAREAAPQREAALREVSPLMAGLVATHGAERALVVDRSLRVVAGGAGSIDEAEARVARAVLESGLGRAELVRRAPGHVAVVFASPALEAGAAPGVVMLVEDAGRWLYPYLTQRLGASATSESLLVRREGDVALFLSPLRHDPAPPLTARRSLSLPRFAAAEGLRGGETFGEYRDYRGVRVLAVLRRVPGTDWLLVTKIDRDEALARFHGRLRALGLMSAVLLSSVLALALLARRAHHASRTAELARTEARLNERFRIAAESVSDVVYEWDLGDRMVWLGDVDGLLGWGPGEYPRTAAGYRASIHPEDLDRVMVAVERHRRGEAPYDVEHRVRRKDGSYAWWAVRGRAVRDSRGEAVHWIGAVSDVSRRKADEERLLHLNAVLRAIRDVNQIIAREKDVRRLLPLVCECLVDHRGYHGAWVALVEGHDAGYLASAGVDTHNPELQARFAAGDLPECARRALEKEGVQVVLSPRDECRDCPLALAYGDRAGMAVRLAPGGRLLGVLGVSVPARFAQDGEERELLDEVAGDVGLALQGIEVAHERRRAEEALRLASQVLDESIAAFSVADREGTITRVNPAFLALWGFARSEDAVGRGVASFFADPAQAGPVFDALDTTGRWEGEFLARRADGTVFLSRGLATALRDAGGAVVGYQSANLDVTEQRRAEEALAAGERKYRHFFEQELAGHYVSTRDSRLVTCNNAFARLLGFPSAEAAVGSDVVSLYASPAERDVFLDRLRAHGRVDRLETELVRRDGSRVRVIESAVEVAGEGASPGEIHGFVIDDTDRRLAREEFHRAQKMEAVGRLAGGVAHDFNNLLGVILGHAELLLRRFGPEHPGAGALEQVRLAAERGARLTRQLLAFSRRQVLQPRVLDLNAVVRSMEPMLARLIGEDVHLVTVLAHGLGRVRADEGQVEQVLMNLAVNARDAMPRGGRLTIETANVGPGEGDPPLRPAVAAGPRVTITVSDTGHGMDAATLAHVFEPFFTTKPAGEGTGLGLATVYGIVQQSGGRIEVESEASKGAVFRISLPRIEGEVRPPAPRREATEVGGHETVLLVEDDAALRAVIQEILETAGYRVYAASRSEEALAIAAIVAGGIDLLLSDVVMPGGSGPELAAELLARRPGLRVLYTSGYTYDAISRHGIQESGARLLQKPFSASDLLRAVRVALEEPAGPPHQAN